MRCQVCLVSIDGDGGICELCESFGQRMADALSGGYPPGTPVWNYWFVRTLDSIAHTNSPLKQSPRATGAGREG